MTGARSCRSPFADPTQVHARLLDVASAMLVQSPQPAAAGKRRGGDGSASPSNAAGAAGAETNEQHKLHVTLALRTLGDFGLVASEYAASPRGDQPTLEVVMGFLDDADVQVRETAAVTCCSLLACFAEGPGDDAAAGPAGAHEEEVLERVLTVAVADPDPVARDTVLSGLTRLPLSLQELLAHPDALQLLFMAVGDLVLEVRKSAVKMLGLLSERNPAHVLAGLRSLLADLLTEIKHGTTAHRRMEASQLLGVLISACPTIIEPYAFACAQVAVSRAHTLPRRPTQSSRAPGAVTVRAPRVPQVLVPQLHDADAGVAACALVTLGELAKVAGDEMQPFMSQVRFFRPRCGRGRGADALSRLPQLLPQLHLLLQDHASPQKRRAALHALCQLLRSSASLQDGIFTRSPELLSTLLEMLKSEQASTAQERTCRHTRS